MKKRGIGKRKNTLTRLVLLGLCVGGSFIPVTSYADDNSTIVRINNILPERWDENNHYFPAESTDKPIIKTYDDGTTFNLTGREISVFDIGSSSVNEMDEYHEENFIIQTPGTLKFSSEYETSPVDNSDHFTLMYIHEGSAKGKTNVTLDTKAEAELKAIHGEWEYSMDGIRLLPQDNQSSVNITLNKAFSLTMTDDKANSNAVNLSGISFSSGEYEYTPGETTVTAKDTVNIHLTSHGANL